MLSRAYCASRRGRMSVDPVTVRELRAVRFGGSDFLVLEELRFSVGDPATALRDCFESSRPDGVVSVRVVASLDIAVQEQ
jgi:hypothetical protein